MVNNISHYCNKPLYHGSTQVVDVIDLKKAKTGCDFGVGFYLTTSKVQAGTWAKIMCRRKRTNVAIVNEYTVATFEGLRCLIFNEADASWLDFIVMNRRNFSRKPAHEYDVVIGPVADDDMQVVIDNYMAGVYDHYGHTVKEMVIGFLETGNLRDQIALCTLAAIERVTHTGNYNL